MEPYIASLADEFYQGNQRIAGRGCQEFIVIHEQDIMRARPSGRLAQVLQREIGA